MTHVPSTWQDGSIPSGETLRPEDIGKPLAATMAGHHRHAILILDVNGVIRFASTRRLFGCADEQLSDSHLQTLIPTLPMRESTPGYNIAYVRLAFADEGWRRHRAVSADRGAIPVEVSVRPLAIGRSYALLAAVREVHATDRGVGYRSWRVPMRGDRALAA